MPTRRSIAPMAGRSARCSSICRASVARFSARVLIVSVTPAGPVSSPGRLIANNENLTARRFLASLLWAPAWSRGDADGMRRYLLAALWPADLASIAAVTVLAARRAPASPSPVAGVAGAAAPRAGDWATDLIRLGAISCAGGALSYAVMALLGPPV